MALACAYAGTLIFALAALFDLSAVGGGCLLLECPPESDLAATLQQRLLDFGTLCIPGILAFAIGWVLCMMMLTRTHLRRWLAAVALAVPGGVGLALLVGLVMGAGHLFPTSWSQYATWRNQVLWPLPPLLLGPVITIVAGHMLRARRIA